MLKKKNEKPRLHKKVSKRQKFDQWLLHYTPYIIFLTFILVFILFIWGIILFVPGNDSAVVYNWGGI